MMSALRQQVLTTIILSLLGHCSVNFGAAAAVTAARCIHDHPDAARCISLNTSANSLCVLNPDTCLGLADRNAETEGDRRCQERNEYPESRVTGLVMVATPKCHFINQARNFFDIWTIWDNVGSQYNVLLRDRDSDDSNTWSPFVACAYRNNTLTFKTHQVKQRTRLSVKAQNIGESLNYSTYDVSVEAMLKHEGNSVDVVYNDSNQRSCEQRYTPLEADKIRAAATWEVEGEVIHVDVSWCTPSESSGHKYIVAIGEESCTLRNREPPCFIAQNLSSVTIGPFPWQQDKDILVRVYRVETVHCSSLEIDSQLPHLFRNCGQTCCVSNVMVPTPVSSTTSSATGSGALTTMSSQTTPCFFEERGLPPSSSSSSGGTVSPTKSSSSSSGGTVSPTEGADFTNNITTPFSTVNTQLQEVNPSAWIAFVAIAVVIVIAGTGLMLIAAIYCYTVTKKSKLSSKGNKKRKPPQLPTSSTVEVAISIAGEPCSPESKLLTSPGESSQVSTPTSVESNQPLLKRSVLVVYSPNTPETKQDLIRTQLISELHSYGIDTRSHDLTCIKESPSLWLEREITSANAVLCICNKEFKEDWEAKSLSAANSLPLVQSLRHLVHATVNQGGDLSKYAMVFLEEADRDYVPTSYLQGDPRQFMVDKSDSIARFVLDVPTHTTSLS